jgi:hypothetical protein
MMVSQCAVVRPELWIAFTNLSMNIRQLLLSFSGSSLLFGEKVTESSDKFTV